MTCDTDNALRQWAYKGYDCRILKSGIGHLCGYVQVSDEEAEDIRWRTQHYDNTLLEPDVDAHGGITYGPDSDNWVGFDDGHAVSLTDRDDRPDDELEAVAEETERLAGSIKIALKDDR